VVRGLLSYAIGGEGMPSVSGPTDGSIHSYYQKKVDELQEEQKIQLKRDREKTEQFLARSTENHRKELLDREEDSNRTIQNAREGTDEVSVRSKENQRAEIERLKNQTYDKNGKYNGLEADVLQEQLKGATEALEIQEKKSRQDANATETTTRSKAKGREEDHAHQLEKQTQSARDSANLMFNQKAEAEKSEYFNQKDAMKANYERLDQNSKLEQNSLRKETQKAVEASSADAHERIRKAKESEEFIGENRGRAHAKELAENARLMRNSHTKESEFFRGQVKDLIEAESHYVKEKGQGTQESISQFENEWRSRLDSTNDAYQDQITQLQEKAKQSDSHFGKMHNSSLTEKDQYYSDLLAKQNQASFKDRKELEGHFTLAKNNLELRNKKDSTLAANNLETQLESAANDRNEALENQAKAYTDAMSRNTKSSDSKIKSLEKSLNHQSNSDDPSDISPAAENNLRRTLVKEYEKTATAEQDRNQAYLENMRRGFQERYQKLSSTSEDKETSLLQQRAAAEHGDRKDFMNHLEDMNSTKETTLRNQTANHERETANLHRSFARTLDAQRRQYEDILKVAKDDAAAKFQSYRQTSDFDSKIAQRTFSQKQNELIRDYEKKLDDQKNQHDVLMQDTKASADQAVREAERTKKVTLEEQSKNYEQKITQIELQHQERERVIAQSHEDQLEKVKRSNELHSNKKKS